MLLLIVGSESFESVVDSKDSEYSITVLKSHDSQLKRSTETNYLKEKEKEVKAMKIRREANFLEKIRFEFNFKFLLESEERNSLRNGKGNIVIQ
jgi:hypothetical protein